MAEAGTKRAIAGVVLLGIAVAAVLFFAVDRRQRTTAGKPGNPVVLVLSPAHGDADVARRLGDALSRESGITVEVHATRTRAEAFQLAGQPTVDGGILPILDYLLAHQEHGVQASLQLLRGRSGSHDVSAVLLVKADSPITTVEELAGKPVAFADRSSTTGYLLAARLLQDRRVTVQPVFTGDHAASLAQLASGTVVAAATFAAERTGVRVLAETGTVPNEPVFFHPRLPRATRDRLVAAFIAIAASPDGRAILAGIADTAGVAAIDDSAYGAVNDVLAATRHDLVDLVPDGRTLVERSRRPPPPPMGQ
ncbi:MAG TPA: PhnD/SsuA/transferrin family substrate-binding protein [Kofleriaceae bacterium]|nr:PhnD/SsuA/transferrin family substrate-binding protein [Kofleriaceae bacterium]